MSPEVVNQTPEEAMCASAIKLYLTSMREYAELEPTEQSEYRLQQALLTGPEYLMENGNEGIRLGAPGWPWAKLGYTVNLDDPDGSKVFFVKPTEQDEEVFEEWNKYVGEKFKEAGIPFVA